MAETLDAERRRGTLLLALGLGLYWTWKNTMSTYAIQALPLGSALPVAQFLPYVSSAVLGALVFVLVALCGQQNVLRILLIVDSPRVRLVAGLGSAASSVVFVWSCAMGMPGIAIVAELLAFLLGTVLVVCWGSALTLFQEEADGPVVLAYSVLASNLLYLIVDACGLTPPIVMVVSAFPALSSVLLVSKWAEPHMQPCVNGATVQKGLFAPTFTLIVLCGIEETLRAMLTGVFDITGEVIPQFTGLTQVGTLVLFAVICALAMVRPHWLGFDRTALFVLPLLVFGYVLIIVGPVANAACQLFMGAGYWCLYCLIWTASFGIARRGSLHPALVFALVEGGINLMALGALVFTYTCGITKAVVVPVTAISIFIAVVAFVLIYAGGQARLERSACDDTGASEYEDIDPIQQIADEFSLSPRECEVFALLAHGRTLPYIQDELGIAFGTVQAHTRHIYEKVGVANRQELIDIVDRYSAESRRQRKQP